MLKFETHIHTRFSKDSILPLWCIYLMCRIKKIDVVAITDHNTIQGAVKFYEKYDIRSNKKRRYIRGINVIMGSEIMTTEGEIIGLFIQEDIKSGMTATETIDAIKRQNGMVYLPHPYDEKRSRTVLNMSQIEINRDKIDCCECHNGRNVKEKFSVRQEEIAEKLSLTKVIGSDAHTMMELGRNCMVSAENKYIETKEDFLDIISNCYFERKKCIMLAHKITRVVVFLKLLVGGNFNEMYRIIIRRIRK